MLPALQRLAQPAKAGRGPRVLVLTPTRELALQVTTAVEKYSKFMPRVRTGTVLGGMPYPKQRKLLESPLDILVATPGRLIDFIDQGKVDFSRLELLVLDEADRMLDMGFIKPVERIAGATPGGTPDAAVFGNARRQYRNARQAPLKESQTDRVRSDPGKPQTTSSSACTTSTTAATSIAYSTTCCASDLTQAIVFTATKRGADRLAAKSTTAAIRRRRCTAT